MADVTLTANKNVTNLASLGFTNGSFVNLNGFALNLDADIVGNIRASNGAGVMGGGTLTWNTGFGVRIITGNVYPGTSLLISPSAISGGVLRIVGTLYGPASANVGVAVPMGAIYSIDTCVVGGNGSTIIKDVAAMGGPPMITIGTLLGAAGTGVGLDYSATQGAHIQIGTVQASSGTSFLIIAPGFGGGGAPGGCFAGSTIGIVYGGSGGVPAISPIAYANMTFGGSPTADMLVITTAVGGSTSGSHAVTFSHGGLTVTNAIGGTHPDAVGVLAVCFGPPNGPQPSLGVLRVDRTQDRQAPGLRLLQTSSKLLLGKTASVQILDSDGVTKRTWKARSPLACGGRMNWLGM